MTGTDFITLARKIQAENPDLTFRQAKSRAVDLLKQGQQPAQPKG